MLGDESRTLPVCLRDINPSVRVRAAREWAKREPGDATGVLHAALFPSATVYWVRPAARGLLDRIRVRRDEQVAA